MNNQICNLIESRIKKEIRRSILEEGLASTIKSKFGHYDFDIDEIVEAFEKTNDPKEFYDIVDEYTDYARKSFDTYIECVVKAYSLLDETFSLPKI